MKTSFPHVAVLLALAVAAPVATAQETATDKQKVTKTETTTTETKVEVNKPEAGTIAGIVKDGATFSILYKAIQAAGLEETLAGKGPNTVFAPTDEAFSKLPAGTLDQLLLPENKEKLRTLLTYHVIPGEFLSTSLKDGEVKTASGDKVKIDVDSKKIEVDDAKVANADVVATNGIIHVVDKVLVPKSLDGFSKLKN